MIGKWFVPQVVPKDELKTTGLLKRGRLMAQNVKTVGLK